MIKAKLEMQRAAAKFAIFLTGIYALMLFALLVSTLKDGMTPIAAWPIILTPGAAFIYSFVDAVKIHRTTDEGEAAKLWRRSLLYAVIGTVLLVVAALMVNRITPV
ncbi:hypothetical protein AB0F81_43630 [Actinoplanes sp. NPDC024001]|uniref:hypothetical protein n=1 Tax=Actinoplanes sp. NPDC024001 TaxID=3154598 RepID=UPI0033C478FA